MNGKLWLPEHTDILLREHALGRSDREIAAVTGHAAITVFYRRHLAGLPAVPRKRKILLRPKYKITAYS